MKKSALLLLLLSFTLCAFGQSKKQAEIEFEKRIIDLGKFGEDRPIQRRAFVFKNTGNADLYIHEVHPGCSCTTKSYPTRAIKPGETDSIIVVFNGEKYPPRKFRTTIEVHSTAKNEYMKIYLKGEMTPKKVAPLEIHEVEEEY